MVDEAGYLRGDLDDLAAKLGAPAGLIDKVLDDAAGLRSARRVRARSGRMPGAAAQGPEPLRSPDRQAARQPGAARQPQPRGPQARRRRRRPGARRHDRRDQGAQPQARPPVRHRADPAGAARRDGAPGARRQLDGRAQQRHAAARAGQPQLLCHRHQDAPSWRRTATTCSTACRAPTGWSRASISGPAPSCAWPRRSCASRTAS